MKQLFFLIFLLLAFVPAEAQENDSYLTNPIISMSHDGRILAVAGRTIEDSTARLGFRAPVDFFDATTGELLRSFEGSEDFLADIAFSADGSLLAYININGKVAVADVEDAVETNILVPARDVENAVLAWNSEGTAIATLFGRSLEIFDSQQSRFRFGDYFDEEIEAFYTLDWSAESNILAFSARKIDSSEVLVIMRVGEDFELELLHSIETPATRNLAVSDDGTRIASTISEGVLITTVEDGHQFLLPKLDPDNPILSLDWNTEANQIVAGGLGVITVWDSETGRILEEITTEDYVNDVFFSPDGEYIYHSGIPAGIYRDGLPLQEAIAEEAGD